MVLQIIRNQRAIKTISHTVFVTLVNINFRYKMKNFHPGFFESEMLEIFTRLFFIKLLELQVVYSGSLKCYKVFCLKMRKESPKKKSLENIVWKNVVYTVSFLVKLA